MSNGDEMQALEAVTRLVDASLVAVEATEVASRYRMLETVRQYAETHLQETGVLEAARAAEGLLAAKTGTLTGVRALSGFLSTDDGVMAFSFVLNGEGVDEPAYYQPLWSRLVTLLDGYPIGPEADEFAPR